VIRILNPNAHLRRVDKISSGESAFAAVLAQSGEIRLAEKPIHERLHENRQK